MNIIHINIININCGTATRGGGTPGASPSLPRSQNAEASVYWDYVTTPKSLASVKTGLQLPLALGASTTSKRVL